MLEQSPSAASREFRRISNALAPRPESSNSRRTPALSRHNSDGQLNSADTFSSTQKHIRSIISRFSSSSKPSRSDGSDRRATLPAVGFGQRLNKSQASLSSINSEPAMARSEPTLSPQMNRSTLSLSPTKYSDSNNHANSTSTPRQVPNLDYLPLGTSTITSAYPYIATTPSKLAEVRNTSDWERLLSSLDNGQTNIYDTIYGGGTQIALSQSTNDWSPDVWAIDSTQPPPQSVLSFSDESLTSGEDFPELSHCNSNGETTYRGILIPEMSPCSNEGLGLDVNFGL